MLLEPAGWYNRYNGHHICVQCAEIYLKGSRTAYKFDINKLYAPPAAVERTPILKGEWVAVEEEIYEVGEPRRCDICNKINQRYIVLCAKDIIPLEDLLECHCRVCDPAIYPNLGIEYL